MLYHGLTRLLRRFRVYSSCLPTRLSLMGTAILLLLIMLMVRLLLVSARMLVDKEGVAVPMPCSKLRKREGVPLVASKKRPSQYLVQRGGSGA